MVNSLGIPDSHASVSSARSEDPTIDPFATLGHLNSYVLEVAVCRVHWYGISRHIDTVGVVVGLDRSDPVEMVESHRDLGRIVAPRSLCGGCFDLDLARAHIRCFSVVLALNLGRSHSDFVDFRCSAGSPGCRCPVHVHSLATVSGHFCCRVGTEVLHSAAIADHIDCQPSS